MSASNKNRKVVRNSKAFWQLEGESDLNALTLPDPPTASQPTLIRLTHSNSYGPFDEADIFVRRGDPDHPTEPGDLDSATDWLKATLVEELVYVDGEQILRSDAEEPFEDETSWDGTYEVQLALPAGRQSIEIKVVSREPKVLRSMVIAGWDVKVKK
jgi:hypothetical protein